MFFSSYAIYPLSNPSSLYTLVHEVWRNHTDAVYLHFNFRTHDFVPLIDIVYEHPAALKAASPAEGVGEGGIGREVLVDRLLLFFWGALDESMDYGGYVLYWVIHLVRSTFNLMFLLLPNRLFSSLGPIGDMQKVFSVTEACERRVEGGVMVEADSNQSEMSRM